MYFNQRRERKFNHFYFYYSNYYSFVTLKKKNRVFQAPFSRFFSCPDTCNEIGGRVKYYFLYNVY